jgi:Zn-dependent protease
MRYERHPFFERLAAVFDRSWRLGILFGVEVRLHVATLLIPIGALWSLSGRETASGFAVAYVLGSIVALYATVLAHEFGHIFAARRFGVGSRLVTLSPLGGLAHLESPAPSPKAELAIALAGPAVNGVLWPLSLAAAELCGSFEARFAWASFAALNAGLLLFNLLPCFPLDGGRCFRALLALKLHPNRATMIAANVGVVGGAAMVVFGFLRPGLSGFVLVLIGLRAVQTCLFERQAARHSEGPYGEARPLWASDPEAWKVGRGRDDDDPPPPPRRGVVARVKEDLAARAEKRAEDRKAELQAEIDDLLEKVGRVGLPGLSDGERAALKRASEELTKLRAK